MVNLNILTLFVDLNAESKPYVLEAGEDTGILELVNVIQADLF